MYVRKGSQYCYDADYRYDENPHFLAGTSNEDWQCPYESKIKFVNLFNETHLCFNGSRQSAPSSAHSAELFELIVKHSPNG